MAQNISLYRRMPVIIVPVRETAMVRQVDVHGIKAILKTAVLIYGGFLYFKNNIYINDGENSAEE